MWEKKDRIKIKEFQADILEFINKKNITLVENENVKNKLFMQIEDVYRNIGNDYAWFYGEEGNGMLSSIQYSINLFKENDQPNLVVVDCYLFDTDLKLINELYFQLNQIKMNYSNKSEKIDYIDELENEEKEVESSYLRYFDKFFKYFSTIIYLKNIEVFINKRQNFLYSLFNHFNNYGDSLFLILSTNNLLVIDSLEKRIKSRFNFKAYNFFSYSYDFILKILKFNLKFDNNIRKNILSSLNSSDGILRKELSFRIDLGFSVKKLLDFFYKIVLGINLINKDKEYSFEKILEKSIKKISKGYDFDFNTSLINDLTTPEKYILFILNKLEERFSNDYKQIKFEDIGVEIKFHHSSKNKSGHVLNFSNEIYKISLINLFDYGLISLSGLPINPKTNINNKIKKNDYKIIKKEIDDMVE